MHQRFQRFISLLIAKQNPQMTPHATRSPPISPIPDRTCRSAQLMDKANSHSGWQHAQHRRQGKSGDISRVRRNHQRGTRFSSHLYHYGCLPRPSWVLAPI
jgi:hypothetical protein